MESDQERWPWKLFEIVILIVIVAAFLFFTLFAPLNRGWGDGEHFQELATVLPAEP